ncbi:MAG: hypothetical protein ACT4P1_15830 [Sporichthyaceae bacterium]
MSCFPNILECPGDVVGGVTGLPGQVGGAVVGSAIDQLAEACASGAEWAMKTLTTAWLNVPSPDVSSPASTTTWLSDRLSYVVVSVMLASVFVAAWRLTTTRKAQHGQELAETLVKVVLVSVAAATVTATLIEVGDAFSDWILTQAQVDLDSMVVLSGVASQPMLVIILGIVVILSQVIQLGLMIIRNGMIILLAAVLPLAAAGSNTQMGRQWWQKSTAWLIAFVLYKPVAAIIYAATFKMASKDNDVATQLSGIFMIVLAVFALPALMRFLVPATASMASGNAGAIAGAMVGGAIATGAVLATGGASAAGAGFSGAMGSLGGNGPTRTGGAPAPSGSTGPGAGASPRATPPGPGGHHPTGASPSASGGGGAGGSLARAAQGAANTARRGNDAASGAVGEDNA